MNAWSNYFRHAVENFFDADYVAARANLRESRKISDHQHGPGTVEMSACVVLDACLDMVEGDHRKASSSFKLARQEVDLLIDENQRVPLYIACLTGVTISEYLQGNAEETTNFAQATLKQLETQAAMPRYLRDRYLHGFYEFCLSEEDRLSAYSFAATHVAILQKEMEQDPEGYGEALARLAILDYFDDRYDEAIDKLQQCAKILESTQTAGRDLVIGIHTLATICNEREDFDSAVAFFELGYEYAEVVFDKTSPTLNDIRIYLASLLMKQGQSYRAEDLFTEVIKNIDTRAYASEAIYVLEEFVTLLKLEEREQMVQVHQKRIDMVKSDALGSGATIEERQQFAQQQEITRRIFTGPVHPIVGMFMSIHSKALLLEALGATVSRVIEQM